MRRLLSHILALLLCLPYLACAMPGCGHDEPVASDVTACVNHEKAPEQSASEDLMFLSDCAEVEVALVQAEKQASKSDVKKDLTLADVLSALKVPDADVQHDTEPWSNQRFVLHPDIILATQRFRL